MTLTSVPPKAAPQTRGEHPFLPHKSPPTDKPNQVHSRMSLDALPAELVSRICRYVGIELTVTSGGEPMIEIHVRDFQSLRSTCKVIHVLVDSDITFDHNIAS